VIPEPEDKLDTMVVSGPEGETLDWRRVDWRGAERNVWRLRQRIFTASRAGDLARVRRLQALMLRSRSNALVSVRRVTDTLNWTEPSSHWKQPKDSRAAQANGRDARSPGAGEVQTSSGGYSEETGELLVIYKILVLAPVLVAVRLAWQARREGTG
jgi:hypothetical protein